MRRIVVGHNESGLTEVLSVFNVEPISIALLPGAEVYRLWELDQPPTLPVTSVQASPHASFFPGPGGLRFGVISIPPGLSYEPHAETSAEAMAAAFAEAEAKLPGMMATFDTERPGLHATATTDFVIVLSGQGRMRSGDHTDVRLSPGDCVIQNGGTHGWFNDGSEPFVFCYTLCGAEQAIPSVDRAIGEQQAQL
jgi:mannose-6-phosphate isomerase-like protein (cupin superfamily)